MKKIFAVLLIFVFLCGCGKNNTREYTSGNENIKLCSVLESDTQYSKILTEQTLGTDGESYINLCFNEQYIALYGLQPTDEMIGGVQVAKDCITLIHRENLEKSNYLFSSWDDVDPSALTVAMDFLDETNILLLFAELKGDIYTYKFYVYSCTENTFEFLSSLDNTRARDDDVCDMKCMNNKVYIAFYNGEILCYDMESCNETVFFSGLFTAEFVCSPQGTLYAVGTAGSVVEAVPIMTNENSVGTVVALIESTWYQVSDGFGIYDFYITYENKICGVSMDDHVMTNVFDGYSNGVDLNHVHFFSVGNTLLLCDNVTEDFLVDKYKLYSLEAKSIDEEERVILTLATLSTSSDLQEAVVSFNKKNTDYVIEINDYGNYGDRGATRLYADIMSGNVPDILNLSGLHETSINNNVYLLDLLPYMQSEFGEDLSGVQSSVIEAQMAGRELLTVTPNYKVKVICSYINFDSELTTDLFLLFNEDEVKTGTSRSEILDILLENTVLDLIDPVTNTFDVIALQELLLKVKDFPADTQIAYGSKGLYSGELAFAGIELSSFRSFRQLIYELGDEIKIYGYPGLSKDSVIVESNNYLSITTASEHPNIAWDFIATMLNPEFQQKYSHRTFPLVTEVLEELVIDAKSSEAGFSDNASMLLDRLFSGMSLGATANESICEIIKEEAAVYFSGDKSLEDVVKIIESRIQIVLSEQS